MLFCFTSSHRTAGFDLLDRLERGADAVTDAIREQQAVTGSVVLATCNRFEAYLDVDLDRLELRDHAAAELIDLVASAAEVPTDELRDGSQLIAGDAVATHLFSVSSGLESVVVGEGEIAGQVRRAYTSARKSGAVTHDLERLFQGASRTSRGVKNSTGLMTQGRSMVRLALDLAESRFADWSQVRVLLVGTGRYAAAALAALRERGVTDAAVWSRTGRAHAFSLSHGISAVPADGLTSAVASADLVITCTVSPGLVVTREIVSAAMADAEQRLLVVDLGLPRNVDPAVAEVERVELLDLETISLHAPLEELQATDSARELVGAAAAEFAAKTAEREVEPALLALRRHVFDQLEAEVARHASRDANGDIERALRHLVGVLLHTPSVKARELARDGDAAAFVEGVTAVFGVEPTATEPATRDGSVAESNVAEQGLETA
ncbi:glutamyl-tRNA reductase [Gryllotalpicola protaetiae]|uniref:Glutamyl-tRNA reductase n=1 Tax=Gryllotalpicola protaetiae TaxID=2419771 RepID=A0A387BRV5_9MICO|nr:glutamyl-tRNA reductase [Gryllotalpicola protaetiae]AYG03667.1 glutamyl-tRNA reductase [Gryllotalpicola protaetiae]